MLLVINVNFYVPVFQLLPDSSTYCKFKRLTISPERMTLLVKTMLKIEEKIFFTLTSVIAGPKMLV